MIFWRKKKIPKVPEIEKKVAIEDLLKYTNGDPLLAEGLRYFTPPLDKDSLDQWIEYAREGENPDQTEVGKLKEIPNAYSSAKLAYSAFLEREGSGSMTSRDKMVFRNNLRRALQSAVATKDESKVQLYAEVVSGLLPENKDILDQIAKYPKIFIDSYWKAREQYTKKTK